jgi:membrane protein YqaA with SNARE-associated domain
MLIAYLGVLGWAFLSATWVPLSVDGVFVALVVVEKSWFLPVLVASLGNIAGGITTFWLSGKGGELALAKLSEKNRKWYDKASAIVQKWGALSLVLSPVPFLGDAIVTMGGIMKLPFLPSFCWLTLGKVVRFMLLAFITLKIF